MAQSGSKFGLHRHLPKSLTTNEAVRVLFRAVPSESHRRWRAPSATVTDPVDISASTRFDQDGKNEE